MTQTMGQGQGGGTGRGTGQGGKGMGAGGNCVCPKCGHSTPHRRGLSCYQIKCPKCETLMVRR